MSALVYGDGEYATVSESSAEGSISVPLAGGAGGFVKAKVLHKRKVHGYVAALITITDSKAQALAGNVLGDPAAVGVTLTEQSLPDQVKARFESRKIRVVDTPNPWATVEFAYQFMDGNGELTENEFVRRYRNLTGSNGLDAAETLRRQGLVVGGAISLAASVPLLIVGLINLAPGPPSHGDSTAFVVGVGATVVGGFAAIAGTVLLPVGLSDDGRAIDHHITKFDAELYAARYNRELLRQTISETKTRMKELSGSAAQTFQMQPVLSPGFVGLTGRF